MNNRPIIAWFRHDLRLEDNPALHHASKFGSAVVPVFIWAPEEEKPWAPGAASRVWLHHSLDALNAGLGKLGSRLILRQGATIDVMRALVEETGAKAVFWNRRYEPAVADRDKALARALCESALDVETFNAS
ncbi:MAG: deoxyribodipyrimidine photo-lyase, partial [Anaerolineae bacterium]|nr:deoxyribodipyrimidine photo-lyase [Anaerolineae bacterium]